MNSKHPLKLRRLPDRTVYVQACCYIYPGEIDSMQTERSISLAKLSRARQELTNLEKETAKYGACDPAKVEEKKRAVVLAKEASIRWTGKLWMSDKINILLDH